MSTIKAKPQQYGRLASPDSRLALVVRVAGQTIADKDAEIARLQSALAVERSRPVTFRRWLQSTGLGARLMKGQQS